MNKNDFGAVPASGAGVAGKVSHNAPTVVLRLRQVPYPTISYMIAKSANILIAGRSIEKSSTSTIIKQHYSFSAILEGQIKQSKVYETIIGESMKRDESFTLITYGISGSGKTYTLLGHSYSPGLLPRAIENIFSLNASNIYPRPLIKLDKGCVKILDDESSEREVISRRTFLEASSQYNTQSERMRCNILAEHDFQTVAQSGVSVFIWISVAEIYNENVYDLLAPQQLLQSTAPTMSTQPRQNLKIFANDGKSFIKGLTSVHVQNSAEAQKLLYWGLKHVTYVSTNINNNSSCSHRIYIVDVLKYTAAGLITQTSYKFCDLTGPERLDKTGNVGKRLTESKDINTSIMTLDKCLNAANNNSENKAKCQMIPVGESKLTMFLQAALLGKEKLTMMVNVMPTDAYYEENMNVLRFAAIAKNIIFKEPVRKRNKSRYSFLINQSNEFNERMQQSLNENISLHSEIKRMKNELNPQLLKQNTAMRRGQFYASKFLNAKMRNEHEANLKQELQLQQNMLDIKLASQKRKYEKQLDYLRKQKLKQRLL